MATIPIELAPGIDVVSTPLENRTSFSSGSLVRFFLGPKDKQAFLQKRGGWSQLTASTIRGTARGMHAFFDLNSNAYIGIGTEQALEVFTGAQDAIFDITPINTTSNLTNPFSTVLGSPTVTITDAGATPNIGDWINIATAAYVGGLVLQGEYQVQSVLGAGQYTITAGSNATANVAAGGTTFSFTTINGSAVVTFQLGAAVFTAGSSILVYLSTTVGGLTFSGSETLLSPTTFNPGVGPANANGAVSENGGQVQILYLLPSKLDNSSTFVYGIGPYGQGPYGVGSGQANALPNMEFNPRQWSIDNFGQFMLAAPNGLPLFQWDPPFVYNNRATAVSGAPQFSTDMFVAMPQEQVVSLGSDGGGFQDPLLVRFSDLGNYVGSASWTASATNQAGSYRLTKGARIVGGLQGDQQGFIWTDEGLWVMTYIGFPLVYSFIQVAHGCGLIAKRAAALVGGRLIWCGHAGFWEWNGQAVIPVPCSVWDLIFGQGALDLTWANNVHAFPNSDFSEIDWYFPVPGGGGLAAQYVSLNLTTNVWSTGIKTITSGIDRSDIAPPTGADGPNGLLQMHEVSTDANGQPMAAYAITHWFTLTQDGAVYDFVERILPDFIYGSPSASVLITIYAADFVNADQDPSSVNDASRVYGPFTVSQAVQWIIPRARGRLLKMKFDFSPLGSFARLGSNRAITGPAGRR